MLGTNYKWVVRNDLVERVTFDTSPVGSEAANPGDICKREVRESRWNSKSRDPETAAGLQYSEDSQSLKQSKVKQGAVK